MSRNTGDFGQMASKLWAKSDPFHPLWSHMFDVAAVTLGLIRRFGTVGSLSQELTALFSALHDLGKADPWFQNKSDAMVEVLGEAGFELPPHESALIDGQRRFRHEARSAEWVLDWLLDVGWGHEAASTIAVAIHGHHGNFRTELNYVEEPEQKGLWGNYRRRLFELLCSVLSPQIICVDQFEQASEVGAKLSGMIILADWIASNDELFHYPELASQSAPEVYFSAAIKEAERALDSIGFGVVADDDGSHRLPDFCTVWPDLQGKGLRPVQQVLERLCVGSELQPGLTIIEAPMGEGKTEAAIYVAECWNKLTQRHGCFLALPTQATANQIHQRYERFLAIRQPAAAAPRLVHGMSWLVDDTSPTRVPQTFGSSSEYTRDLGRDWFKPSRRALLTDNGVGTVDQVLMAALNVKFGFLRWLGLSAKTLVIDEVHAYDEYMTTIMQRLLEWCRALRVNVVLLSATLSARQKRALCHSFAGAERTSDVSAVLDGWAANETPYPLITSIPHSGPAVTFTVPVHGGQTRSKTIAVHNHHGLLEDFEGTARLALKTIADGGCACVLANTVKAAQAIFSALLGIAAVQPDHAPALYLFHARFPAFRRAEIERSVTDRFGKSAANQRPKRAILVATQVVEQSLDVDFDVMLSQIAPVDLLLQRSGRIWRHERPVSARHGFTGPSLHVLLPGPESLQFGPSERVYDREILLRTLAILHSRTCFDLPREFRALIETCYGTMLPTADAELIEEIEQAAAKRLSRQHKEQALARTHLLPLPSPVEFNPAGNSADEAEGGVQSFFVAQTRLGDDSLSALLLDDDEMLSVARSSLIPSAAPPRRELIKRLFLCKVSLPRWWLMSGDRLTVAADGYEPFFEGDSWLRHQLILPMRTLQPGHSTEWRGYSTDGQSIAIFDDKVLGVYRQSNTLTEEPSHGENQNEADAGQLG